MNLIQHSKRIQPKAILALFIVSSFFPMNQAKAWGRYEGGDHPDYNHRYERDHPVVVHHTIVEHAGPPTGCLGCGVGIAAVAGLVGGIIIGSAIANHPAPVVEQAQPQTIVVQAPPQTVVVQGPAIGSEVSSLPPNCTNVTVNGGTYYQCGPIWYQPFFGGNGVYYTVIQAP